MHKIKARRKATVVDHSLIWAPDIVQPINNLLQCIRCGFLHAHTMYICLHRHIMCLFILPPFSSILNAANQEIGMATCDINIHCITYNTDATSYSATTHKLPTFFK